MDGTSLSNLSEFTYGKISSVFQELRLTGDYGGAHFVVGGDYAYDQVYQYDHTNFSQSTTALTFRSARAAAVRRLPRLSTNQIENDLRRVRQRRYRITDQ